MNYRKFEANPALVDEFVTLCSNNFTPVDICKVHCILPSTMDLYSNKIPAREASCQFLSSVSREVSNNDCIEKNNNNNLEK
jgi:hypothetical protein